MSIKYFKEFQKRVTGDPQTYYQDYLKVKEKLEKSTAIYQDEFVQFLYQPFFLSEKDLLRLKRFANNLTTILKKVIKEYKKNPEFRQEFMYSKLMEKLVLHNPGYEIDFPMARYDLFYSFAGDIKLCELNADGTSAMNEVMVLQDLIANSKALTNDNYRQYELFYTWIEALLHNYKQFSAKNKAKPTIAIMDFAGEGTIYEFIEFQNRLIAQGYPTIICDPRQLEYKKRKLYYRDKQIDLIYRRATTARLLEEADDIQDFIQAYLEGAVCVVGGLVSQIIHNKILFAVLHQEKTVSFLTEQEISFIKKHIPYTVVFNKKLVPILLKEKDKYILKPFDQYASHGVYVGQDYTNEKWQEIITNIKQAYLVQEFIKIPQIELLTVKDEKLLFEKYGSLLSLYMYNQKLSGFYTRVGRKNIIGSIVEAFTVPNYVMEEKGD